MPSKRTAKYCPNCGNKVTKKAKFCIECGFDLQEEEIKTKVEFVEDKDNFPDMIDENYEENDYEVFDEDNDETKCPVCNTYMKLIEEGRNIYRFCPICEIEFKEEKKQLYLNSAPENTRIYKLYRNKRKPWIEWKNIGLLQYMPEEEEEFLKFTKIEDTDILCPSCDSENMEIFKKKGFLTLDSLICPNCRTRFEIINDKIQFKFSLVNDYILWEYYSKKMSWDELYDIIDEAIENDDEYDSNARHEIDIVHDFYNTLDKGLANLSDPSESTIVLKKNEVLVLNINDVILKEPRAVSVSKRNYIGSSYRLNKRVTIHSGSSTGIRESTDVVKWIDKGQLVVTNKRIIFLGEKRTTNIDLNKIISISSDFNEIQIQRSNKQKPEYFTNISSEQYINIENETIAVEINGPILRRLIVGLL